MAAMTWLNFKQECERQGVKDTDLVDFIDIDSESPVDLCVTRDTVNSEDGLSDVAISNYSLEAIDPLLLGDLP